MPSDIGQRRVETPASRSGDPVSSKLAEQEINASGMRMNQQEEATLIVCMHPGATTAEMALLSGMPRYMLCRRLPECVTAGAIRKGAIRKCTVSNRRTLTWYPV